MDARRPWTARPWPWLGLGVVLAGVGLFLALGAGGPAAGEREEFFPLAEPAQVEAWTTQWRTRTAPHARLPDPPGQGPVVRARYWLSRAVYDMEVRRRGERFVVAIGGVDPQFQGGGWTAFGEGRITGDAHSFGGAVATFSWSCLSTRYRHMSDGVGRLWFDGSGEGVHAMYMAYESPASWAKAYGRKQAAGEARPAYASLRGQIPCTPQMPRRADEDRLALAVTVTDERGTALEHAQVGLKGNARVRTLTDAQGRATLVLEGRDAPYALVVSAGLPGHRNDEAVLWPDDDVRTGVTIVLSALAPDAGPGYVWQHASGSDAPDDLMACGTCHEWQYAEWHASRHARAASNGLVTWERANMRSGDPGAPDDCLGCHQPPVALDTPDAAWKLRGVLAGIHCDFCHKVQDVGDVQESGALGALVVVRPDPASTARPGAIHHVFGPLFDSTFAWMGASWSPVFAESRFCAACHQGGGRWRTGHVAKIDTYEEWRAWVAEQPPETARTCQGCHMPGASTVAKGGALIRQLAWDGLHRSAEEIHTHRWDGTNPQFASRGFELEADKARDEATGEWVVTVRMKNSGAGHKIPTGTWGKHVVVGVWAATALGPLRLVGGDRALLDPTAPLDLPLEAGDWRNPGGFVLGMRAASDVRGDQPLPSFWHAWPPDELRDERLAPGAVRTASCRFEPTPDGSAPVIEVRVLHRRAWLPGGAAGVPWTIETLDPPPEVLWRRIVR